jgi:hypothetical protein
MVAVWFLDRHCLFDVFRHSTPFIDHQTPPGEIHGRDYLPDLVDRPGPGGTMATTPRVFRLGTVLLLWFTSISNIGNHAIPPSTVIIFCHCHDLCFPDSIPLPTRSDGSVLGSIARHDTIDGDVMWRGGGWIAQDAQSNGSMGKDGFARLLETAR